MAQLVVTTGKRFVDLDGLACVIAYQEIPPEKPLAVIAGPLNNSVTNTIRKWPIDYLTDLEPGDYEFVIVDVSEAKEFPLFVNKEKVVEIYDHHFGFEKFWAHLGEKAKIEPVGACATLIWEEMRKRKHEVRSGPAPREVEVSGSESKKWGKTLQNSPSIPILDSPLTSHPHPLLSPLVANLLYTAILSNTLNFQSSITTERDKKAFEELKSFTNLPKDWIIQYYQDQEVNAYTNPEQAIASDTKIEMIKGMKCAVGELELWNSMNFIKDHKSSIESTLRSFETELWFLNAPSIGEGRSYIFTKSETLKNFLRNVIQVDFFGTDVGVTKKLWLRKEILRMIQ